MNGSVLIPNRCQPVGRQRRWQRSSDDPAKKASARTADDPAIAISHQIIDYLRGIGAGLRKRLIQPLAKLLQAGRGASRSIVHPSQVIERVPERASQHWRENVPA
jgi:electron transfer flavoprotein alpha subunit